MNTPNSHEPKRKVSACCGAEISGTLDKWCSDCKGWIVPASEKECIHDIYDGSPNMGRFCCRKCGEAFREDPTIGISSNQTVQ